MTTHATRAAAYQQHDEATGLEYWHERAWTERVGGEAYQLGYVNFDEYCSVSHDAHFALESYYLSLGVNRW